MSDLPCRGRSWLFDSTDPADHAEAAAACRTCPAILDCARLVADTPAPEGTWAGQLYYGAIRRGHRVPDTTHRPAAVVPPCGTESAYQRHKARGEKCEPCRLAHNAHNRARYAERSAS